MKDGPSQTAIPTIYPGFRVGAYGLGFRISGFGFRAKSKQSIDRPG